jgi:GNAT superfamily N-acetyltransferase
MPWVIRDAVNDLNKVVARRWQSLDPLLPEPNDLPEGCTAPFLAAGGDGRPAGLGICRHQHVPADTLAQTWGAATKFVLTLRLREPDTQAAADDLLNQWRDHLQGQKEAQADDTAAVVNWPSRDVTGILALQRHGLQPMTVIAARPAGRPVPADAAKPDLVVRPATPDLVVRPATPDDLDAVAEMEMGVVRFDAHFGGSIPRPATEALVRAETQPALAKRPSWIWIAEQHDRPVALAVVEPPQAATWIAGMTRPGATAYLQTMFVRPGARGGGVGAALVRRVHDELDARRIDVTLLHYSQMNPLSAPFWHRMGYRPLWTTWEARPAAALR